MGCCGTEDVISSGVSCCGTEDVISSGVRRQVPLVQWLYTTDMQ